MCCVENRESFDAVAGWKKQVDSILMVRRPSILLVNKVKSYDTLYLSPQVSHLSFSSGPARASPFNSFFNRLV